MSRKPISLFFEQAVHGAVVTVELRTRRGKRGDKLEVKNPEGCQGPEDSFGGQGQSWIPRRRRRGFPARMFDRFSYLLSARGCGRFAGCSYFPSGGRAGRGSGSADDRRTGYGYDTARDVEWRQIAVKGRDLWFGVLRARGDPFVVIEIVAGSSFR